MCCTYQIVESVHVPLAHRPIVCLTGEAYTVGHFVTSPWKRALASSISFSTLGGVGAILFLNGFFFIFSLIVFCWGFHLLRLDYFYQFLC